LYLAWAAFQRRQVSMAELVDFECVFLPLAYKGPSHWRRLWHYLRLSLQTLQLLRQRRPSVLWLQLPQVPLLWVALLYRALVDRRVVLVADSHNALFRPPWSTLPLGLSLLARCNAVLVHNRHVHAQALQLGMPAQRLRVLEDVPPLPPRRPLPPLPAAFAGRPRPWVLYPGSFSADEPVAEVLQAAALLGTGVVAVTGRLGNAARNGHAIDGAPAQVVFTDYLPVADFDALMLHGDVVLALTRQDGIQLSVCNEALGFGRPMVVSDTPLLRELFGSAGVMVDSSDPRALAAGIRRAFDAADTCRQASQRLAQQRRQAWLAGPLQDCLPLLKPVDGRIV
jgi:glycosyltransferase involved in cell wall biosynthesis